MTARAVATLLAIVALSNLPTPAPAAPRICPPAPQAATIDLRAAYARPPSLWPPATGAAGTAFVELGRPAAPPAADPQALLGRRLFEDPLLSHAGDLACVSCHRPDHGWADDRPGSITAAGGAGRRNTPSLFGAARRQAWRWDGSVPSLSAAVVAPLVDEMGNADPADVVERLMRDPPLAAAFRALHGERPTTVADLAAALAAFVATLDAETPFDRFVAGDASALSDEALAGLHLFRNRAGCAACHFGPDLTDEGFHNLGLSSFGEASRDLGRHDATEQPGDAGRFRTPSLRHVVSSAPYMHHGLFRSLEGVVKFYVRGGGEVRARHAEDAEAPLFREAADVDARICPLDLSPADVRALVAFLKAL